MIIPSWLTTCLSLLMSSMLDVSKHLKFKMMSWMKAVSWSLFGARVNFDVWMISSDMVMSIKKRAWSEDNQDSGRIEWWSSSGDLWQRNMRSMTELDSPAMSEYLVEQGLVGFDRARSKESAIIIKSSLTEEWKGNNGSHKMFLMLKPPVIRMMLSMLTSVSLRYFKAVCDESE